MAGLRTTSINARGLNEDIKRNILYTWLKDKKIDIAFIQETFCTENFIGTFNSGWDGIIHHAFSDSKHSRGVCIIFNSNLNIKVSSVHRTDDGRRLLVNASIDDTDYTFICLYAPNTIKERCEFFHKSNRWITKHALYMDSKCVGGDMNCCLRDCDRRPMNLNDKSRKDLSNMIENHNLQDCWPLVSDEPGFTFYDKRTGSASRLDYIFCSKFASFCLQKMQIVKCPVSDHENLIAYFKTEGQKRGKGYWKINNSFLENDEFKDNIIKIVKETENEIDSLQSYRLSWELFKIRCKEYSIRYGISQARERKCNIAYLEKRIYSLNEKLNKMNDFSSNKYYKILLNEKVKLETELRDKYDEKTRGSIIRSRVKWLEEGEKGTSYFLKLEKARQSHNIIKKVNTDGKISVSNEDIIEDIANFYKALYSSDNIPEQDVDEYFSSIPNTKTLNDNEKDFCEKDISLCELTESVRNIKNNKSPGPDGLSPEFYKEFWEHIKQLYFNMIQETFEFGELPDSLKCAIITLIYKKGDKELLKNYRPISLTNYDYKILAYTLASRMQKVIKSVVDEDQNGYIKGRNIGYNIRILDDLINYCRKFDINGYLICLDFEKAFDSVNWYFLISTLKKFNFGNNFIKWIQILYKDPTIQVKNNGHISEKFKAGRGVRQGCPVSALLFLLVVEIMAIKIRQNNDIKGFSFGDVELKLTQYADDSTLLLLDLESIGYAIVEISKFSGVSGLKLNILKCEGMCLGKNPNFIESYKGIKFTKSPIKCMGIYIGGNIDMRYELNWRKAIEQFDQLLDRWKGRDLTYFGKSLVLKSLAISQLVYKFNMLQPNKDTIHTIKKIIYNFIWKAKDRIKRNVLIGKNTDGGIGLIDVESKIKSLKASWIPRLCQKAKWSCIIKYMLNKIGLEIKHVVLMNFTNMKMMEVLSNIPAFYVDVFCSYNESKQIKQLNHMTSDEFLSMIIWGQKLFQKGGQCLFMKNWIDSGIVFVKDLFVNGKFVTEDQILSKLQNKSNWIAEYSIIKKFVFKKSKDFDCMISPYINTKLIYVNTRFLYNNKWYEIDTLSSKFFYDVLIDRKYERTYAEKIWQKKFNISIFQSEWKKIYNKKVLKMPFPKMKEFNYKLIHNLVASRNVVSKWNKNVSCFCPYCNEIEDVEHMLFKCIYNQFIWKKVGETLSLDIQYRHIVLGFWHTDNEKYDILNLIVSCVAFCICKKRVLDNIHNVHNTNDYTKSVQLQYKSKVFLLKFLKQYETEFNFIINVL